MSYTDFVRRKLAAMPPVGIEPPDDLAGPMFPHQDALCRWAIRRGRAAVFADTGLGKTRIQLAWADAIHRATGLDVIILAPLAVAEQTAEEGAGIGVKVTHARTGTDTAPGINITNYERLHRFDTEQFGAVVLDESSCIKHHDTKTLATLMAAFRNTPYKLCATATPAPNDWTELGTHAEFLGVCTQAEMLSEYFVHDGGETQVWRLKGHARHEFWRWVSSWGALVRSPADLGFDGSAYILPPLIVSEHLSRTDAEAEEGKLFALEASTLSERRSARKASLEHRVADCVNTVKSEWYKMAAPLFEGAAYGVEAGIRRGQETESAARCDIQSAAQCSVDEGQGCPQGVHEAVLQSEPGEISATHAGETSRVQCGAPGEVCAESGVQGRFTGKREGLAESEPTETQVATTQTIWTDPCGIHGHDDGSGRKLRNLRPLGHEPEELLSGSGSLPRQRKGAWTAVHELQHGDRKVSGRSGIAGISSTVSLEPWLIWCDLNSEQDALSKAFGETAFSVYGSQTPEQKEDYIKRWLRGERPVMISKPSIMGWGINAQHCARMAFVGVTDSFEAYYQAVRRCWRFGQQRPVDVHIFASQLEGAIIANLKRKEADAKAMSESLAAETGAAIMESVLGSVRSTTEYNATRAVKLPAFLRASA